MLSLKKVRRILNWSIEEMSLFTDIPEDTIRQIEAHRIEPTHEDKTKLEKTIGEINWNVSEVEKQQFWATWNT